MEFKLIVESLIFAADKPLTMKQLRTLTESVDDELLNEALNELRSEYDNRGIQLVEVSSGFQFRTHPDNANWVRKLLVGKPPRLTKAMLEVLAIVAYRQPITRPEIEDIRGVDCGGVLRLLLERCLIRIMGKREEVGRPILYGTTKQFLEFFNLRDLRELPTLREFTELSEENAELVTQQYGEESAPATEGEANSSPGDGDSCVTNADSAPAAEGEANSSPGDGDSCVTNTDSAPATIDIEGECSNSLSAMAAQAPDSDETPPLEATVSTQAPNSGGDGTPSVESASSVEKPDTNSQDNSKMKSSSGDINHKIEGKWTARLRQRNKQQQEAEALNQPQDEGVEIPSDFTISETVSPRTETSEAGSKPATVIPISPPPPSPKPVPDIEEEEEDDEALLALDRALDKASNALRAYEDFSKPKPAVSAEKDTKTIENNDMGSKPEHR